MLCTPITVAVVCVAAHNRYSSGKVIGYGIGYSVGYTVTHRIHGGCGVNSMKHKLPLRAKEFSKLVQGSPYYANLCVFTTPGKQLDLNCEELVITL